MAKRGRPKKIKKAEYQEPIPAVSVAPVKSELEELTEVYEFLKSRGIHSISALEAKLSQLQNGN